jgi:hypothetical protein
MARLKGQETQVVVTSTSTGVETSFGDIKSGEINLDMDILSEGYLGQTTEKKDSVFKGVSGSLTFHSEDAGTIDLMNRIKLATQLRLPGEVFSIVTTYSFANGSRRIVLSPVSFGTIPINNGGRDEYVEFKLDFAADDGTVIAV